MSIRKALNYISERLESFKAAAGKWSPEKHPRYPKGHPKAGKFMSKRDIEEAKSGKSVGQSQGDAKANQTKQKVSGNGAKSKVEKVADGISIVNGDVRFSYNRQFKTPKEAVQWLGQNVAQRVRMQSRSKETSLSDLNGIVNTFQMLHAHAPLKQKLHDFEVTRKLDTEHFGIKDHQGINGFFAKDFSLRDKKRVGKEVSGSIQLRTRDATPISDPKERAKKLFEEQKREALGLREKWNAIRSSGDVKALQRLELEIDQRTAYAKELLKSINDDKRLEHPRNASRNGDAPLLGTLIHEYGHAWHYQYQDAVKAHFGKGAEYGPKSLNLAKKYMSTGYSGEKWAECFAENFALYMMGQVRGMHKDMVSFFDKQFPTLSYGKRLAKRSN